MALKPFSLEQLRQHVAQEITRADTSFLLSQAAAHQALARDLVPGAEMIAVSPLEIDRAEISFHLQPVHPPVWQRLWRWLRGLPTPQAGLYRLSHPNRASAQVVVVLQRNQNGQLDSELKQDR